MTRIEALKIVRAITESATTERQIADLVDCLDALGVLKLELEVNGLQALAHAKWREPPEVGWTDATIMASGGCLRPDTMVERASHGAYLRQVSGPASVNDAGRMPTPSEDRFEGPPLWGLSHFLTYISGISSPQDYAVINGRRFPPINRIAQLAPKLGGNPPYLGVRESEHPGQRPAPF